MSQRKFQIFSDIHLEHFPTHDKHGKTISTLPIIERHAPNLILAGDICEIQMVERLKPFIMYVSELFENVIYVPGNHEYYSGKRFTKTKWDVSYFPDNVHFLDNDCVVIDGIKIVGTTLWTHIPWDYEVEVGGMMNDYRKIYNRKGERIRVRHTNEWHEEALEFLEREVDVGCIVVSHHAPLKCLNNNDDPSPVDFAYYSDVPLLTIAFASAWIYGHTHVKKDVEYLTTRIMSNPMGYQDENTNYSNNFTFSI
jgi:predicted phosphohydrolase